MQQYEDADTHIIQKDTAYSDNEGAKSKPSKTNKQRKVDKKRVTAKKAQILSSNDDVRIETPLGKEKNSSQNNIQPLPNTSSSSSALSCLMGMVKRNHSSQEEIEILPSSDTPNNEIFNNNHFDQASFEKGCDTAASKQLDDKHSKPVNDATQNIPQSAPYFDATCPETKATEDAGILSNISKENLKDEGSREEEFHRSSSNRKRTYSNIGPKSNEPSSTESKFFRFTALAKELSGR